MGMKQIWDGNDLPPVGCEVLIHLASMEKWIPHKVTGHRVEPSVSTSGVDLYRVTIDVEGNSRLLGNVRPLDWREEPPVARDEACCSCGSTVGQFHAPECAEVNAFQAGRIRANTQGDDHE